MNNGVLPSVASWPASTGAAAASRLSLNGFAVAAFVCGAAGPITIRLVGEIFVGELLLMQFLLLLLLIRGSKIFHGLPAFGTLLQLAVLMLVGYMLSDIYRDAHPAQYLRGWARIILVALDFIALAAMIAHDKRNLWWFFLGMAVGGIGYALALEIDITTVAGWKSSYAVPLVGVIACLSGLLPLKIGSLVFAAVGICNIFMDFRILGAICVLVAGILWIRSGAATRLTFRRLLHITLICALIGAVVAVAMVVTQEEFAKRREQSNAGRSAGLTVAVWAIAESPLIGYGSWPMDQRLIALYQREMQDVKEALPQRHINAFASHSQVLQGWVEGGLMAVLFWLYYGYWLVRAGWYVVWRRPADAYLPVFAFLLIYDLWHLLMSPFAASTRLLIATGIAVICVCAAEARNQRRAPKTSNASA